MIPFVITVLYISGTLLLGVWMSKNNRDMRAFATANGSVGALATATMLYTASVGPGFTVGTVQSVYTVGLSGLGLLIGQPVGYLLFVLPQIKVWRKMGDAGMISHAEQMEFLYGKGYGKLFSIIMLFLSYSSCAIGPSTMAALIAPMIGLNRTMVAVVLIVILSVIVALGGIKGAAATSLLHAFFLFLSTGLVAALTLSKLGGFSGVTAGIPAAQLDFAPNGWWVFFVSMLPTMLAQPIGLYNSSGVLAAKSNGAAQKGVLLNAVLLVYNMAALSVIGLGAVRILPDGSDSASAIYLAANSFGPLIGALMSVGIIAAIFSSLIPMHITSATVTTRNLIAPFSEKIREDPRAEFRTARIVAVLTCAVVSLMGMYVTSLIAYLGMVTAFSAPVAISWLIGLVWHRVNEKTIFTASLAGAVVSLLLTLVPRVSPLGQPAVVWSSAVTAVLLLILTAMQKEPVSEGWRKYEAL